MSKDLKNFEFTFSLKCYPISFINRKELEKGDKIILPPSVLESLSGYEVSWPLMFEINNKKLSRNTHCGVIEFTSDEGCVYVPQWFIEKLFIQPGEKVFLRYVSLEKGSFVKLQPQTDDFLEISNPKAVLESKLRNFTCLTKDDVIAIDYNEKIFWLNILEVKPGNKVSIIETDLNVDFAPPVITRKTITPSTDDQQDSIEKKNKAKKEDTEEASTSESIEEKRFNGQGFAMK